MKDKIHLKYILYLFSIAIVSVLFIAFFDEENKKNFYFSNYGYAYQETINISSKINISVEDFEKIIESSSSNNIGLEKKTIEKDDEKNITNHYLNLECYKYIINIFKVKDLHGIEGIVTYNTENNNLLKKLDFFNNDFHSFKLFDEFYNEQTNLTGEYTLFFESKESKESFIKDLTYILGIEYDDLTLKSSITSTTSFNLVRNICLIMLGLIVFSIFIISLFINFKQSKKIGVYKLMGFSTFKIMYKELLKEIKSLMSISLIMSIIVNLLITNNCLTFIIKYLFVITILMLIEILIIAFSTYLIIKRVNLNNLLKKKSLTEGLIKFNIFFKIIVLGVILFILLFVGIQIMNINNRRKELDNFSKYSQYAVFSHFYMGSDTLNSDDDSLDVGELELFKYLEKYDVVYADFRNYFPKTKEAENLFNTPTKNGNKRYHYGTIDFHYLDDLELINSITGEIITISPSASNRIFLIPESFSSNIDSFKRFYYEYYEEKSTDEFIIYNDKSIPTLSPEIGENNHYMIDSPILKVITSENVGLREISIYGVGYDTPLKIKINKKGNKEDFYLEILPILKEFELDDNLPLQSLFTIGELFENEINEIHQLLMTFEILIVFLLIIYLYILFQNFSLYLQDKYKEIAVKKLNGFSDLKIFRKYVIDNLIIDNLVIMLIFSLFYNKYLLFQFFQMLLLVNLLELTIIIILIKMKLKKFIIDSIKGGEL